MKVLVQKVRELQDSEIAEVIAKRIVEFENVEDYFSELCFCLMTANFKADKSIEIQEHIGQGFHDWDEDKLRVVLKEKGHRFWPQRAERIVRAREHRDFLGELLSMESKEARGWLAKNVYGLGMKEASHFLRNVGKKDVAIVDFHIVDLLYKHSLIREGREKGMSMKRYLEIEEVLEMLGSELGLDLAELDLYLWYLETGKVLK